MSLYRKSPRPGHGSEWRIELGGDLVGHLDDPRSVDMFWTSYSVKGDLREDALLRDDELWGACRFQFRCSCCWETAPYAFCGGREPFVRDGRVLMRALVVPPPPTPLERLKAWFRGLFR